MELNNPQLDWAGFGRWIDENKGAMSNRELARRVGLSPTQVGNIIAGTSKTTTDRIMALAQAIGKSQREAFMVLGAEKPVMTKEEVEFLSVLRSVPNSRRQALVEITKGTARALCSAP